jgi:hypothetical protein
MAVPYELKARGFIQADKTVLSDGRVPAWPESILDM